ncbi:MAG: LysM peptidoglycan-binding domain-containing protein [Candidatus Puniceispirillaceae bacterium]
MRLIFGLLLLGGGALAALAVAWMFYSTSEPNVSTAQTDVSQTSAAPENTNPPETKQIQPGAENNLSSSTPSDISTVQPLSIDVARIGPDGSAVIAGTAPPETEIRLLDTDQPLAKTLSNSNGEWVAIPDQPLSPGNHLIIAEMTGKDGQIIRSERGVLIELAENGNEKPLVALVPMTGDAATEILSAPRELASTNIPHSGASGDSATDSASILAQKEVETILVALPEISIGTLSWHSANILEIKGQSVGGAAISGSFGGQKFGDVALAEDGSWSTKISVPASQTGRAVIQANLLDLDDSIALTTQIEIDIAQLDVGLDGSEMVVIRKGDVLWRIAYRTYGRGIRYLDILKRNASRIDNPDLIYPSQIFALPETATSGQ